jgi:N-methylhydantoinase B/oxoprolinase/acetone carboxylase alpha subunit
MQKNLTASFEKTRESITQHLSNDAEEVHAEASSKVTHFGTRAVLKAIRKLGKRQYEYYEHLCGGMSDVLKGNETIQLDTLELGLRMSQDHDASVAKKRKVCHCEESHCDKPSVQLGVDDSKVEDMVPTPNP